MKIGVILATYNSNWDKIKATLLSVISQKNVDMSLILADDGSSVKHTDLIIELFDKYKFNNYEFNDLSLNEGTVKNYYNASKSIDCDFIKLISPGDLLFDNYTLYNTMNYMTEKNADAVFGNAVYYSKTNQTISFLKCKANPAFPYLFNNENEYKNLFVDYLLANDTILGANILYRASVLKKYLNLIVDKVKYAEDLMIKIMIFDKLNILYYNSNTIYYEQGVGISHSKRNKNKLDLDKLAIENIILGKQYLCKTSGNESNNKYINYISKRYKNAFIQKIKKYLFYPQVLFWKIKRILFAANTSLDGNKLYVLNYYNY